MSEHHIRVVRVGPVTPHPKADRLDITTVGGYPVCMARGSFKEGDLAVYVPVDAVVPATDPRWAFLEGHTRIRAKKLREVFSMGLLTDADPSWVEGQDVATELGITKYEPIVENPEQDVADPGIAPVYDIEGWRRYTDDIPVLFPDPAEEVVATEKLHGENARFAIHEGALMCGSHYNWKKESTSNAWWATARLYQLADKLSALPADRPLVFFGEILGHVPDMNYGHSNGARGLAFYDIMEVKTRTYLPWDEVVAICTHLHLPLVPVLYRGRFDGLDPVTLAEGKTTYPRASGKHVREGFVVKPIVERRDMALGRVTLKMAGQGYHLRKNG